MDESKLLDEEVAQETKALARRAKESYKSHSDKGARQRSSAAADSTAALPTATDPKLFVLGCEVRVATSERALPVAPRSSCASSSLALLP